MGTETCICSKLAFNSAFSLVKLNNPLMGTETISDTTALIGNRTAS